MNICRTAPVCALVLLLGGCLVGPNYHRPAVPVPPEYKELEGWTIAQPSADAPKGNWWIIFHDPLLDSLEPMVSVSNQTVRQDYANYQEALAEVEVADLDGGTRRLPADRLLPFFGLSMDLGPIAQWGLDLERHHVAIDPATCETNIPGVFAIGDVATYKGKLKLILQGFSEAAMAAHAIHPIARPGEALHFEYSTSKGVP